MSNNTIKICSTDSFMLTIVMANLEEIKIYVTVINHSNFTSAAKTLGISKQLVSRRIMALEARLGAHLLNRTTRQLSTTELGRVFYEHCLRILRELQDAEQAVSQQLGELRGLLRISAPVSYASMVLPPALNAFMLQHLHLDVQVDVDNRIVDIIGEGYDLAIRITPRPDAGLIAKKLADAPLVYCCSPHYASQYGVPDSPKALRSHRCITQSAEWVFKLANEHMTIQINPVLRSNHGEVMRDAAIAGIGITCLPEFYVADAIKAGKLLPILVNYTIAPGCIYAFYPQHKQASPMVRAFADHLQHWFSTTSE